MKRYYLGLNADGPRAFECLFKRGRAKDMRALNSYLAGKYQGASILMKNGRSALTYALKSYLEPGDKVLVTGFTCHAVYEAVIEAGMAPVFCDIETQTLNFDLEKITERIDEKTKGIIVQNTLGNVVEIEKIEALAEKYGFLIFEDLAHSAGMKYLDGREVGTIGVATALSFGKDKMVNSISGGAVVLRDLCKHEIEAPSLSPMVSDYLRARFYPMFCAISKGLNKVHLGGAFMKFLFKIRFVEKSADNRLDLTRRLAKFQARLALEQMKRFYKRGEGKRREFYLVKNRDEVLEKLRKAGYFFDGFWYEKPVSPERYYDEVGFPEKECPTACKVAEQIINVPTYYKKEELKEAMKIIRPYLERKDD